MTIGDPSLQLCKCSECDNCEAKVSVKSPEPVCENCKIGIHNNNF